MSVKLRSLPVTLETRAEENGKRTIAGQVPYGIESEVLRDVFGDNFVEELAPRCFDESLKVRDVVALWSHVLAQVLGGTKNRTLRLTSNEERLLFDLDLPDTQAGRDAWESIRRGDVDGVSFGMVVKRDKWSVVKNVTARRSTRGLSLRPSFGRSAQQYLLHIRQVR
jgi:HK97 family phage prohead protease